jgi:DedD protein
LNNTLKHRLVGATVLAAIAILFLPSFFKEKQTASVNTKTQIPKPPVIVPVEFKAAEAVEGIESAPAPETMFVPDEQSAADESNNNLSANAKLSSRTASSEVPTMSLNAQSLPDAWVVQVGSFSTKEAANKVRDELQTEGFKAYVRSLQKDGQSVSRVYIGPKLDRAEAQLIKLQIDKHLKVNSILTRFQP